MEVGRRSDAGARRVLEAHPDETATTRRRPPTGWPAVTGLLLLSALPVLGGVLRLGSVGLSPETAPSSAPSATAVVHIVAMSVYCLLGAFQFSPALRTRHRWHRRAGRVLIPAGFLAALSGIWLGIGFVGAPGEVVVATIRLLFLVPLALFLVLAVLAIARRAFVAHGAWMTRAYAIAVSGGTQALVLILWTIPSGGTDASAEAWSVALGFAINGIVAEALIRRRARRTQPGTKE